jgi:5'-nucleotidase
VKRPLILVTNDDGIIAPGIRALVEEMKHLGEVVVVAPDSPQSAQGHAITLMGPLRLKKVDIFEGIESYECSGTPADCVKIAKSVVLKGRTIDLCVSGVNHGSNASVNIIYSGTMSAAMEASLEGINSIGFSLEDFSYEADFSPCKPIIREISKWVLGDNLKTTKLLNVNFPKTNGADFKGVKICKQSKGYWSEEYHIAEDPRGEKYYWLTGEFINQDTDQNTDKVALQNGYVSVVPSHHDLTQYESLNGELDALTLLS